MVKVVIVTGGDRGIGFGISQKLAREGWTVVILNRNEDSGKKAVEKLKEMGYQAANFPMDASKPETIKEAVSNIVKEFGQIDGLVNNAGVTRDKLLVRMNEEDWDFVLDIDLKGVFLVIKECAKTMMKQRNGSIVNITSVIGRIGNVGQANYSAAKAGLIGLTRSLSKEMGLRNIRVNAVAPGFIETEMTGELPEEIKNAYLNQVIIKRPGKPEDVANCVEFLLSEKSAYITGQVINVDGGMVLS